MKIKALIRTGNNSENSSNNTGNSNNYSNSNSYSYSYINNGYRTIERIMMKLFIFFFCLLIIVQIAMTNDKIRYALTPGAELEGRALEVNEFLFNEGKLRLQLVNIEPSNNLKILVNGEVQAVFNTNIIEIPLKDGDVLGVDCSTSKYKGEIEIVSKTPNILTDCVGKRFKTDGDPRGTIRIRVKSANG